MANSYSVYQVPQDVDERLRDIQRRLAEARGVKLNHVSRSGDVLRHLLATFDAAEQLYIKPAQTDQPCHQ